MTDAQAFVGVWEKVTRSPCSEPYPHRLVFRGDGQYRGESRQQGMFTIWDVGTFEMADGSGMKISTANDAVRRYTFTLVGDELTFVDPEGCRFAYRRAG